MSFNSIRPIALSLTSPLWIYRKEAPNNSFLDASLLLRCFLDACHSFDHAVEVKSRLSTITDTSQISLGRARKIFRGEGGSRPPRTPGATCLLPSSIVHVLSHAVVILVNLFRFHYEVLIVMSSREMIIKLVLIDCRWPRPRACCASQALNDCGASSFSSLSMFQFTAS